MCRFLRKLKCYVRNKSRPEGSTAEGYIVEESLMFCSRYLHDIDTNIINSKEIMKVIIWIHTRGYPYFIKGLSFEQG